MSEVTWFKIFPDGNKCFVVAYAGAEPVEALRTINKDKVCDYLRAFPKANNIHVANLGEPIPRVDPIIDYPPVDGDDSSLWIPFAKTPKNDQKLAELANK